MKKIFILLIGFICLQLNAQNDGVVIYGKKANLEQKDLSFEQKKMAENLKKDLKKLEYKLMFNRTESSFQLLDKMKVDNDQYLNLANIMGGGDGYYYTNIVKESKQHQKEFSGKDFIIDENLSSFQWQIKNENKLILGHKVTKAVTFAVQPGSRTGKKVKIEAWFTSHIPVHAAPLGYSNLPGLVLELTVNDRFTYTAKKITLKKNIKIVPPEKGEHVSLEIFNSRGRQIMRKMHDKTKN